MLAGFGAPAPQNRMQSRPMLYHINDIYKCARQALLFHIRMVIGFDGSYVGSLDWYLNVHGPWNNISKQESHESAWILNYKSKPQGA